ncbi:ATP-dependent nuclease [Paenibacillus roseipurpureus]|uniref:AAA family ATPase n=1 Tax=Paenibacillus roseopurpureus TaxID=2918901 RepID=A0AA96LPX5_9BACL|nr:AAA family ATPase [Paenibacillus sp. MBLB1832]WNR45147.1 AAA family ATPase [Paenibacillus sp. MBLB1832]
MSNKVSIATVDFKNFKALRNFSIRLEHMNILVGPNNAGKSTSLSAFRALGVGIKQALSRKPYRVAGPDGEENGYTISEESLPMSLENVHTDYVEVDSRITFTLTNGNAIILYFPREGGCNLLTRVVGTKVSTPTEFKRHFPIELEIIPVLGPIEQNEPLVTIETVKKGMTTHRASRHFRNYWRFFPEGFDQFAEMVSKTWSGMSIEAPKKPDALSQELIMFVNENRIPRELYWAGFGFQIWCQLLTHISRSKDSTLLIVDEPEVYLHPDVQRQLLGILRDCGPDILLASHSKEILEEADPSEIIMVNKNKQVAMRLPEITGIGEALNSLGSVPNVNLTHLARSRRILFVDGQYDYKLLRRLAKQVDLNELSLGNDITAFVSGGYSNWEQIKSFATNLTSDGSLHIGAIFNRDFELDQELSKKLDEFEQHLGFFHVYESYELENYLLDPVAIDKAVNKAIEDRFRRTGKSAPEAESIHQILDRITEPFKRSIMDKYLTDKEKSDLEVMKDFESKWKDLNYRMTSVKGKEVLRLLKAEVESIYSVKITDFNIIDELTVENISGELKELLFGLEEFRVLGE